MQPQIDDKFDAFVFTYGIVSQQVQDVLLKTLKTILDPSTANVES